MKYHLSQDVTLEVEGCLSDPVDARVSIPMPPVITKQGTSGRAGVDITMLSAELSVYGLALMSDDEAEPEMLEADRLTVWCYSLAADLGTHKREGELWEH